MEKGSGRRKGKENRKNSAEKEEKDGRSRKCIGEV
jgi:hypothetical protein